MEYIHRIQEERIHGGLARGKSILLLGPRQTGKTTLMSHLKSDWTLSFVRPDVRQRYEKNPAFLIPEVEALADRTGSKKPLVILDEAQRVPDIFDVVQDLVDRKKAVFVLTGSSARKLRRSSQVNLLPGRLLSLRLDPLILNEAPRRELKDWLLYGSLPGILAVQETSNQERDLESYVTTYLEEEIRAEAIVRNVGSFARFLEYAASESGKAVNLRKLSQEIGVAHTTIAAYYQILEDCLIAERIEPLTLSKTRKKLTKSQKYLFFDLGVRRLAAHEGTKLPRETWGSLLEQWVGLEFIRLSRLTERKIKIRFWRDPDGPEVDWVLEENHAYTPIEVKWTDAPSKQDIKHLELFLSEYKNTGKAYLVCRCPRPAKLSNRVTALPWQEVDELIFKPQE